MKSASLSQFPSHKIYEKYLQVQLPFGVSKEIFFEQFYSYIKSIYVLEHCKMGTAKMFGII